MDTWLTELVREEQGIALVAVGGYGRAELSPGSDVDVLLLHAGRRDVRDVAERIWYPLWNAGLKLGHATRTVKEALALADSDLETATATIDARVIAGDVALGSDLAERARRQWEKRSKRWLGELARSVAERHVRAGEVAFLLEPDLKEGRGGLRDVQALRWAEVARPIVHASQDEALADAYNRVLRARVELHRRTGKAVDRMFLQEQDAVAASLGIDADALMADVASAGRTIAWTSDDSWRRIESALRGPKGRVAGGDRPLGPGIVLREDEVHLTADARPGEDPTLVLRAAAAAAQLGVVLGRSSLERLADEAIGPGEPWPEEARSALISLLGAGHRAIPVLEGLDQRGLLERVLPEWSPVRSRPQRNAYHRFTVDRHLCEAAAEAAALTRDVGRPDLLLVGAWLHDIGKGYPGDHTEGGVELMQRIATRMGFDRHDVKVLVALVRHHLLLPDTATRRALDDPATTSAVAKAVGDRGTLALLAALTEADSKATGDTAWSPWKAELIGELVARTELVLAGEQPPPEPAGPTPAQVAVMERVAARVGPLDEGLLHVLPDEPELVLVAPDQPGLFCLVAGTLALHGVEVLAAEAWSTDDGVAFEVFRLEHAFGEEPDWERFERDLALVLAGETSLEVRLARRAQTYAPRRRESASSPPEARVLVDNEASASSTVVEVRAPDGVGVLYRITKALARLQLDVRYAKVQTLGQEVVDTFYVRDVSGGKVPPERAAEVEAAVLEELARLSR